jgi:hypothetical protein
VSEENKEQREELSAAGGAVLGLYFLAFTLFCCIDWKLGFGWLAWRIASGIAEAECNK